jgi:hypothetical protein
MTEKQVKEGHDIVLKLQGIYRLSKYLVEPKSSSFTSGRDSDIYLLLEEDPEFKESFEKSVKYVQEKLAEQLKVL